MNNLVIALIALAGCFLGIGITLLLGRIEFRDEFEVEEFKKFTDALRATK